ncbi:hypothetical protein PL2TA16_01073 [Pseudoalteromonas luteoviolacea 2ta16]|uniref:Uncharacterized protein n=1 Tax=Pseudoalteromonas luteoviolacea (strain 2ta16) TaxID=1353533 RepID=V4J7D9_PSEL2|nr:hypothetical protein PL2TA16_01073 [Pseudoalteromonas luteoviolacea 2ta16]
MVFDYCQFIPYRLKVWSTASWINTNQIVKILLHDLDSPKMRLKRNTSHTKDSDRLSGLFNVLSA